MIGRASKSLHTPTVTPQGPTALFVRFNDAPDDEAPELLRSLMRSIQTRSDSQIEAVLGFDSLTVVYDDRKWDLTTATEELLTHVRELHPKSSAAQSREHAIPVCYALDFGIDLSVVAEWSGKSVAEVIQLHSSAEYQVRMLGFAPGFPYLSGLPAAIAIPRSREPRTSIPAGSVAIGGEQTGIYPTESPGGWRIIGATPWTLFDPDRSPPTLLQPGDRVRFVPIEHKEFTAMKKTPPHQASSAVL